MGYVGHLDIRLQRDVAGQRRSPRPEKFREDGGAEGGFVERRLVGGQGVFRSAEVGRDCLPLVMKELQEWRLLTKPGFRYLFARFSKSGGTAADSFQRAVWTTFFNDFDFAAYRLTDEAARWEIRVR